MRARLMHLITENAPAVAKRWGVMCSRSLRNMRR